MAEQVNPREYIEHIANEVRSLPHLAKSIIPGQEVPLSDRAKATLAFATEMNAKDALEGEVKELKERLEKIEKARKGEPQISARDFKFRTEVEEAVNVGVRKSRIHLR